VVAVVMTKAAINKDERRYDNDSSTQHFQYSNSSINGR